jgi:DNA-binding CsgD family transcriptional regulator
MTKTYKQMSPDRQTERILGNMFGQIRPRIMPIFARDRMQLIQQFDLSERELQTMSYASFGLTTDEIADRLRLSPETVDTYRKKAIRKLNVSNMVQAVAFCIRYKIIE